ncbi:dTMP kinase [Buchnera aphidicola (Neophyllaphis podocarpi)]|uniref:dTMP kinase n=1 Tax=Buchnera aphidicola TaxID=9 RepID=UPI0031B7F289
MKGKFIVIEGIEGAGKTSAINYIAHILRKEHKIKKIKIVREPGNTPIAEKLRKLIQKGNKNEELTNISMLLLIYAARIQLIKNIIKPSIKKGSWVIGDRHTLSSFAYQGGGFKIEDKIINKIHKISMDNFKPNLTLFLDVLPSIGLKRILSRKNRDIIENKSINFFENTRKKYIKLIKYDKKIIKINANLKINQVYRLIKNKLNSWIKIEKCL